MKKLYVKITEAQFQMLVTGHEVIVEPLSSRDEVHLILEDMGWARIMTHMVDAMDNVAKKSQV